MQGVCVLLSPHTRHVCGDLGVGVGVVLDVVFEVVGDVVVEVVVVEDVVVALLKQSVQTTLNVINSCIK